MVACEDCVTRDKCVTCGQGTSNLPKWHKVTKDPYSDDTTFTGYLLMDVSVNTRQAFDEAGEGGGGGDDDDDDDDDDDEDDDIDDDDDDDDDDDGGDDDGVTPTTT